MLKKLNALIPSLPEQEKIGEFLSALDDEVDQAERLVSLLSDRKRAYAQSIFNRILRFRDDNGNPYPEWEEKKLGEVTVCLDSQRKPLSAKDRTPGDIPYYGSTSIQGYINGYVFNEDLMLISEDAGNFYEYQHKPISFFISGKSWVNNHAHVLRAKPGYSIRYLHYSMEHRDICSYVNGKVRAKLNQDAMKLIPVPLPSLPEQEKIGSFLSVLDDEIDEAKRELELLKKKKKAYSQRIFGV